MSFRARLVLLNMLLVLFTLLLGCGVFIWSTGLLVMRSIDGDMLRAAQMVGPRMRPGGDGMFPPLPMRRGPDDPHRPRIFDANGVDVEQRQAGPVDLNSIKQKPVEPLLVTVNRDGESWRVLTRRAPNPDREEYIQVAHELSEFNRMRATQTQLLLLLIPFALFIAAVVGWWTAQKAVAPIEAIATSAEGITEESLDTRLESHGTDELARLTKAFNAMLGRLSRAFADREASLERQRNFAADASHELRTPLARIRLVASGLVDQQSTAEEQAQSIGIIHQASVEMSQLVDQLLLLARLEGSATDDDASCEIVAATREATELSSNRATINVDVDEHLLVHGPAGDVQRAIQNLVQNAVRYTPDPGKVTVRVAQEGADCVINVIDEGIGIAPDDLPHLGERFYRTDASRSREAGGNGLGIAIAKEIVHRCDGELTFNSELGKGTTATIRLPIFQKK